MSRLVDNKFDFFIAIGSSCLDPNGVDGKCIAITNCHNIKTIFETRPISPQNRKFLKKSQCGYIDRVAFVCCANILETTTKPAPTAAPEIVPLVPVEEPIPEWLKKLRQKLPLPPNCGLDSHDRILGGSQTEVDEFPWLVLVEFKKREISIHLWFRI